MDVADLPMEMGYQSIFSTDGKYKQALERARLLAQATIIPTAFRESIENCMIALELANRFRISVVTIINHIVFVEGQLGWDAQFIISLINTCGRFESLQFEFDGDNGEYGCTASTVELSSGKKLIGPKVDWNMVRAEKWDKREDSKWLSMPEVMFVYRAGTFWGRRHCPELILGMRSADELEDIIFRERRSNLTQPPQAANTATLLNDLLDDPATNYCLASTPVAPVKTVAEGRDRQAQQAGNDPQFELAKIVQGADGTRNEVDLMAFEKLAEELPGPLKLEARETISHRREELGAKTKPILPMEELF